MKKKIVLAVLFMFILFSGFGYAPHRTSGLDITAYNGQYHNLIINPLYGNLSDPIGMPFDLTRSDVQYIAGAFEGSGSTAGRQIAEWSVHSNFVPVSVKIEADNLMPVDKSNTSAPNGISYYLFFPYIYYNYENNESKKTGLDNSVTGFMMATSGSTDTFTIGDDLSSEGVGLSTGIYPIRFMLTQESTVAIENKVYDPGEYTANVKITIDGGE